MLKSVFFILHAYRCFVICFLVRRANKLGHTTKYGGKASDFLEKIWKKKIQTGILKSCHDNCEKGVYAMEQTVQRIGVINDVHGNLAALQAVLSRLEQLRCGTVICTGDVLAIGPCSGECLALLRSLPDFRMVFGNHERYFLTGLDPQQIGQMSRAEREHQLWVHRQLSSEDLDYLFHLPRTIRLDILGHRIIFTHYGAPGPQDPNHPFCQLQDRPTAPWLDKIFQEYLSEEPEGIFYGHHHFFSDIHGKTRYVNCGSLGCPHSGVPLALAGMITVTPESMIFTPLMVPYNAGEMLARMDAMDMPERGTVKRIFYGLQRY